MLGLFISKACFTPTKVISTEFLWEAEGRGGSKKVFLREKTKPLFISVCPK
jgi:hypothetical protein